MRAQRGERGPARLVGKRDADLGAAGERLEQRPLGGGQVLEAVGEHGLAVPGVEIGAEPLAGAPAQQVAIPEPDAVELGAVGGEERGQVAVEIGRVEEPALELGERREQRVGEARRNGPRRRARRRSRGRWPRRGGRSARAAHRVATGLAPGSPPAIRSNRSSNVPIAPPSRQPARSSRSRSTRATSARFGTIRNGSSSRQAR